jgi:hypothetical protein
VRNKPISLAIPSDNQSSEEFSALLKELENHIRAVIKKRVRVKNRTNNGLLICQQLAELERLYIMRKIRLN